MKRYHLISLGSLGVVSALLVSAPSALAQQRQPPPKAAPQAAEHKTPPTARPFAPGVAEHLGMTGQALEDAYQAALKANPKLTRGQFVAANILAKNLSGKNPNITTQARLDGLSGGTSLCRALQGLGLSGKDARAAETQANREARESGKAKGKPSGK